MRIQEVKSFNSLGELWIKCMQEILIHGNIIYDDNEKLLEMRNYYARIKSVDECDIVIKSFVDPNRLSVIDYKYTNCKVHPDYKISYGQLLYDNMGVNQVEWVIQRLQNKLETKSATISLHNPGNKELSCLSLLDFKCRNDILHMNVVYRSQNVYASQHGNIIVLSKIQKYIADKLHIGLGDINLMILSAHIYERDKQKAQIIIDEYINRRRQNEI